MLHKLLTKKIIISSFFILLLIVSGFFGFIFFALHKISDTAYINNLLRKKTDLVFVSDKIEASLQGLSIRVISPDFSLVKNNDNSKLLSVKDADVKIKILPFFLGKVSFDGINSSDIDAVFKRNPDGSFDDFNFVFSKNGFFKADFSKTHISINRYMLVFNDLYTKCNFSVKGSQFDANGFDFKKHIVLRTNGVLSVSDGDSVYDSPYLIDLDFEKKRKSAFLRRQNIFISSINTSFLKKYLHKFGFTSTDATVDICSGAQNSEFSEINIYMSNINFNFDYKGEKNTIKSAKPVILTNFLSMKDSDLVIKKGAIFSDGIDISYSGSIKHWLNLDEIMPELHFDVKNTQLRKLAEFLPDTAIPFQDPYVKNIKLYNANAVVNGEADFWFKDSEDFNVKGKLTFDDVFVVSRPVSAKTSFGECIFLGRDVLINVFVNAPNQAYALINGKTKMKKLPYAEFDIVSVGKLDMAFAHQILLPVQKILNLKLGPLPYMTLKGDGEIELHTRGTKADAKLNGWFVADNATVTLNDLNTVLNDGKVKIVFDETDILFKGANGKIGNSDIFIDGKSNTLGDMDIDVFVKDIPAKNALNIAITSPIVTSALDGGEFLKSFKPQSGNVDFNLKIYGNVPPDAVFGAQSDTVFTKGKIIFKGVNMNVEPQIKGTNIKGVLNFDKNTDFDITCNIFNSPFKILGKVSQKGSSNRILHGVPSNISIRFVSDDIKSQSVGNFILDNIKLFAPQNRMFARNLALIFNGSNFKLKGDVSASGLVYPNNTDLDLSGFDFSGSVSGVNFNDSDFVFKQGDISLKGKDAKFNKLRLNALGADFIIDGNINKFASLKPFNNLNMTFYPSSFVSYVKLLEKTVPQKTQKILENFSDFTGLVTGKISLYADKIDGMFNPQNVSLVDNQTKKKIILKDGKLRIKNEKTFISAVNVLYGDLPIYVDGFVQSDGDINPEFNIFVSTNLNEKNCDELLNPFLTYPLLVNGELLVKGRLQGRLDSYTSYLSIILNQGSDLSLMGLKLGDTDSKREIASKINFGGNLADIKYIRYFKYISSQNNKPTPYDLIKVSGKVKSDGKNISLINLGVHTPNPAPVRFLNLLFKKSIIKDGVFTSDLVFNGTPDDIKAVGHLAFSNVFVPLYDSVIENIKIDLNGKTGKAQFKISMFDTVGTVVMDFVNSSKLPAVVNNISIHSESVSIDNLMKSFASFAGATSQTAASSLNQNQSIITPSDIRINKGSLNVDKITFNGVEASNLKMNFSHSKDAELKIDDTYLAIAGGLIKGSGSYNFDTKYAAVNSDFINCDANELTKAFLNLSDQIYGNANGKVEFKLKDFTPSDYVQKINAAAEFEIIDGKLPKLGSIEYLLRASSMFRGGIFGLTINSVIELLKPYRHGEFNKISGSFKIEDAVLKDLKLYSQGDNLSTYTYGSYDIMSGLAEIEILGKLSKNVSNLLGPIGNTSVVSILNLVTRNKMDELVKSEMIKNINKIPLIDLNNDDFRLFNVKIKGAASAEDIVKSFNWLN